MIQEIDNEFFNWVDWLEAQLSGWPTETVQYKIQREGLVGAGIRGLPCSCEPFYKISSKSAKIHYHVLRMPKKWLRIVDSRYIQRDNPYKGAKLNNMSRRKYLQVIDSIHKELSPKI